MSKLKILKRHPTKEEENQHWEYLKYEGENEIYKKKLRWPVSIKKVLWLVRNKHNISRFVYNIPIDSSSLNNETIGETAEVALSKVSNIECNINSKRINNKMLFKLTKSINEDKILYKLPSPIISSCGYENGSVDFKLENKQTLSLKTLKYKDGKICPQKVGQPTLKSWDNQWEEPMNKWMKETKSNTEKNNFNGNLDKNPQRWEFIKSNIHSYINKMLKGVFCCDYLILIKNCMDRPKILLYKKEELDKKINYFKNQEIIYTRDKYEERWNEKKKKYSEMSSTIKIKISNEIIKIGEFQFHKSSRKVLKFRFFDEFLQILF
jgi:hypothetical protein